VVTMADWRIHERHVAKSSRLWVNTSPGPHSDGKPVVHLSICQHVRNHHRVNGLHGWWTAPIDLLPALVDHVVATDDRMKETIHLCVACVVYDADTLRTAQKGG